MQESKITTDHKTIREWIEARGGIPARMIESETPTEKEGVLEIKFSEMPENKKVVQVSWSEFFKLFNQSHLAFLFEEFTPDGEKSHFFKFIWRNGE